MMEDQEARIDVDYREAILKRLVQHFRNGDPIPGGPTGSEALSFELLHRLCRHVVVEGYGR